MGFTKSRRPAETTGLHCNAVHACFLGEHFEACHPERSEGSRYLEQIQGFFVTSLLRMTVWFGCGRKAALRYPFCRWFWE
jgi:hypothetical protein